MKKKDTMFKPDKSGNAADAQKGALNKTTLMARALLAGNVYALHLATERLIPRHPTIWRVHGSAGKGR
jgi:hypothetical protein